MSARDAGRITQAIVADLEAGLVRRVPLTDDVHRHAERLLLALDAVPLRAADALQLALGLGAGAATLLTYDQRLREAAIVVGLAVFPTRG